MTETIRVAITGAAGRMGRKILAAAAEDERFVVAAAIEAPGHAILGQDAGQQAGLAALEIPVTDDLEAALAAADVLIDFTLPEPTLLHLAAAAATGRAAVVGTTGFSPEQRARIAELARRSPLILAPNMSVGVNLLFHLTTEAVRRLGPEYDIEVLELHHGRKVDAPSGTAARIAELAAEARGLSVPAALRHGREGAVGSRTRDEIGMHAVRAGDIVGEHTLFLAGPGERLELTHRCSSRANFARGALLAAAWLTGQEAGQVYDMQDVLGLR